MGGTVRDPNTMQGMEVDGHGKAATTSVNEIYAAWNNRVMKQAYSIGIGGISPAGANSIVGYIKNISTTHDLTIMNYKMRTIGANASVDVYMGATGSTITGGTAVIPANRNSGSSNVAGLTVEKSTGMSGFTVTDIRKIGSIYNIDAHPFEFQKPCSYWILTPDQYLIFRSSDTGATLYLGIGCCMRERK